MDQNLSDLKPRPIECIIRDVFGQPRQTYAISPISIGDLIWIAREFESKKGAEDGIEVFDSFIKLIAGGQISGPAQEAIFKLAHHQIIKRKFRERSWKSFKKRHWGKSASFGAFLNGIDLAFRNSSVELNDGDEQPKSSKKKEIN